MLENQEFSRPLKLTHAQTVLYEIDMLRLAKDRLLAHTFLSDRDQWIYIEAFLLHYRNLLEFFGKEPKRRRQIATDLTIANPTSIWTEQKPKDEVLAEMKAAALFQKYEAQNSPFTISKYLHHCTTYRIVARDWDIAQMFEELRPFLERFESQLPEYELKAPWRTSTSHQSSANTSCSTFSTTYKRR